LNKPARFHLKIGVSIGKFLGMGVKVSQGRGGVRVHMELLANNFLLFFLPDSNGVMHADIASTIIHQKPKKIAQLSRI
jgi:hypothetical protein